jgi:hypothetical protein
MTHAREDDVIWLGYPRNAEPCRCEAGRTPGVPEGGVALALLIGSVRASAKALCTVAGCVHLRSAMQRDCHRKSALDCPFTSVVSSAARLRAALGRFLDA